MKVQGFLKDVGGASRVTKARLAAFAAASPAPVDDDPIAETMREWHPGKLELVVTEVRDACKTGKTFRFARADGGKLPYFYAGQYMVLDLALGESLISRPYSIASAPAAARGDEPYVEITVRRSRGDGLICDYLNDAVRPGDRFTGLIGCGQFYYEPLRDSKHLVALAGGVGITPFASMAREIAAGGMGDVDLTVLFGSVSADDIILRHEMAALESERVRFVHVLSGDDPDWTGERGFISAELIRKYSQPDSTYFVCGPQAMYGFMHKELDKLGVAPRRVRFEVFGQVKDIAAYKGFPAELRDKSFSLTVVRGIHEDVIPAKATESLAVALERAGIRIETGCRSGECGLCRTKLLSGSVYVCPVNDEGRRAADREFNYIHACASYPIGDVKIKIPIL